MSAESEVRAKIESILSRPESVDACARLFEAVKFQEKIDKMTDEQFLKPLLEFWATLDITSDESSLISSALERVKRANLGPLPEGEAP